MSDLAAFLRARLDEDEAAALGVVNADGETYTAEWTEPLTGTIEIGDEWPLVTGDRRLSYHIARWDPARVLVEVAAKRAILAQYERALMARREHPTDLAGSGALLALLGAVRRLAQPYADHPDFDPAWR